MDRFKDARDLTEMQTLTRNLGRVFNDFETNGTIIGALGQTDDLTPDVVAQMLAIDPTLVNAFKAEQLAALPDDVFAALPDEYIAGLDGITRDQLAAKALARTLSGEDAALPPVDLPSAWKIQPPQLITFSFDDLPLANYSISGTASEEAPPVDATVAPEVTEAAPEATPEATEVVATNLPEGPALPEQFGLLGVFFGVTLDTADDLLTIQLPEATAQQFGTSSPSAAELINNLVLLQNPDVLAALPFAARLALGAINVGGMIGSISPEAAQFIADHDPNFFAQLSPAVYDLLSDQVLALPDAAPPLDQAWNNLANQPQFGSAPLHTARDLSALGDGSASTVLNTINENVPERFAGYEVRLFDSLSPGVIRYFVAREPDFFQQLDSAVLEKLSPEALALIPEAVLTALPDAGTLRSIASGTEQSAAAELASRYASDLLPADPNAPPLDSAWGTIGSFLSVELDTTDDLFRFFPQGTTVFLNSFFDSAGGISFAPNLFGSLTIENINYMVGRDPNILNDLRIEALQLLKPDVVAQLPQAVQDRIASGATPFVPTDNVTRTNGNPSLVVTVYKNADSNNVEAFHIVDEALRQLAEENPSITVTVAFEQASFVEESISGVAREGGLGAIFAVIIILIFLSSGTWASRPRRITGAVMIGLFLILLALITLANAGAAGGDLGLAFNNVDIVVRALLIGGVIIGFLIMFFPGKLPYPSWRSTIVTAVSIPLSVLIAMTLMRWLPPAVHGLLINSADSSPFIGFLLRLFPESITLNIMTLSGLTVAIGRVVDDSIVVLENIFRQVQAGGDKKTAIIEGTRDVSVAIFAATVITVVVFLPLGLTGGIIGEFFLPFGLAVTYALLSSFIVAITIVPVMAYLLLDSREISGDHESWLERLYQPALRWALDSRSHRLTVLGIAALTLVVGGILFGTRPQAFLPSFGEPQISVALSLPPGTKIAETNALVEQFEDAVHSTIPAEQLGTMQTSIGGGGGLESLILGPSSISENSGTVTIAVTSQSELDPLTAQIRALAEQTFGEENVTVSAASLSEQGFGGFSLVLSGPQTELEAINSDVIAALDNVDGLANVSSSLATAAAGSSEDAPTTYIRVDQQSALSFTGELETQDTLGVTSKAKAAVLAMPNLPAGVTVSEGFQSSQQTEGFAGLASAMLIAITIVILLLIITFRSLVHWLDIILSIVVAPMGAAVLLTLTNRVLGISALIGLLMLIGIVVTNAVVLIDRVQSNQRERGMNTHDALIEAGNRRLRPILMTALATIFALVPLAIGLSQGAIIASELGTVVIGGLFSSTLLTLIIVPVAYMMLDPINRRISLRRNKK
ncbi:MAG: efflux RND transporter permease subunit [Chloroflexota bacterium]